MSREKIAIYQYDRSGKYLSKFESYSDLRNVYYGGSKYPLFRNNAEFHVLPDSTIVTKSRVGRSAIVWYLIKSIDRLTNINKSKLDSSAIAAFNLNGDKIATFENITVASVITGINKSTIYRQVVNNSKYIKKNDLRISFKFIE